MHGVISLREATSCDKHPYDTLTRFSFLNDAVYMYQGVAAVVNQQLLGAAGKGWVQVEDQAPLAYTPFSPSPPTVVACLYMLTWV